jgi:hypothetical protein
MYEAGKALEKDALVREKCLLSLGYVAIDI